MPQDDAVTRPADVPEEAGVWPPRPTVAPPTITPPPFVSLVTLCRWEVALMIVGIGCEAIGLLIGTTASGNYLAAGLIGLLAILVSLATNVLFLIWTYHAYKNLRTFGTQGLRFTPGWAVGYFFIPFMGLYRPYQVFREIWQASNPAPAAREGQHWQSVRVPARLLVWWVSYLLVGIAATLNATQPTPDGNVLTHLLNVINTILAILVVRQITAREERMAAAVLSVS